MGDTRLVQETKSFHNLWPGGFRTAYSQKRRQDVIEKWLKKYVNGTVLEIGCGGGFWTKTLCSIKSVSKIYTVDVVSASYAKFWEYVGGRFKDTIEYHRVQNFCLDGIPDHSVDFVFSYDVFCHISGKGQERYLNQFNRICKPGAQILIMYADVDKYSKSEPENMYIQERVYEIYSDFARLRHTMLQEAFDGPLRVPGIWFWIGTNNFVSMCQKANLTVLNRDLNLDLTNPMTLAYTPFASPVKRIMNKLSHVTKLITYHTIPLFADWVMDLETHIEPFHNHSLDGQLDPTKFSPGTVVFVKTDLLEKFVSKVQPAITVPYFLVFGVSDYTPQLSKVYQADKNGLVLKIISCNNAQANCLIGIPEPANYSEHAVDLLLETASKVKGNNNHSPNMSLCYPFHTDHPNIRKMPEFKSEQFCNIAFSTLEKLPLLSYLSELKKFGFVLCLSGVGHDTHRFTEILLMGCVPVVASGPLNNLYSQFPCVIVNNIESTNQIEHAILNFKWDPKKYRAFYEHVTLKESFIQSLFLIK